MSLTSTFFANNGWLTTARVVSTTNISGTYANGPYGDGVGATLTIAASSLTIDSVSLSVNDEILLVGQTTAAQNGIYVVNSIGATVVLTRRPDFQSYDQMVPGYYLTIKAGTVYAGSVYTVSEPQAQVVGTDSIVFAAIPTTTVTTATFSNTGLKIRDTSGNFAMTLAPGSSYTANRTFTLTTGDAARTLDISAASVTISAFGATLVDDATNLVAQATLGIKRATTATWGGGGSPFSNAFVATGLAATDVVVASILTSTNAVSITKVVPTTNTLTVTFSADPGAGTTVNWIAVTTV